MLRCDIRPPLLEVFFFDEYTNLYVNGGKTDFVWDYSRWAEQAFREYLRDCRKLTLEAVSPALRPETGNLGGAEAPAAAPERAARRGPGVRSGWIFWISSSSTPSSSSTSMRSARSASTRRI